MKPATAAELKLEQQYCTLAWKFAKEYWNYPDTEESWELIMAERKKLVEKINNEKFNEIERVLFHWLVDNITTKIHRHN